MEQSQKPYIENLKQNITKVEKENERLKEILKSHKINFEIVTKETLILNANISYRLYNVLRAAEFDEKTIEDLQNYTITDFSKMRNLGKRTLHELIDICQSCGVELKK